MGLVETYKSDDGGKTRKMIRSESEASLMTPIIKVILPLPKYQKVIKDLRRVTQSQVGVASFVTGKDSGEIIDAVMRAAFPSDSGQVYMGDRWGYNLDASSIFGTDPQQAKNKFEAMLYGNQRAYTADDIKRLEAMKEKFIGPDGKHNPDLANMAIGSITGGAPAPAAAGGFGPVAAPAGNLQTTLEKIQKLRQIRDIAIDNISSIDKIANEKEYEHWVNVKHNMDSQIANTPVPKFYNDLGGAVYDKSGFIDFEIKKVSSVITNLDILTDPAKLNAAIDSMAVNMNKEGAPVNASTLSQAHRKVIAQKLISKLVSRFESMKVAGKPAIVAVVNKIDSILKQGYDTVVKSTSELKKYREELAQAMKGQQKVWIVQNVTDSGLVSSQYGTDNGQGTTPQFLLRAALKSTMAKKDTVSGDRCILFVSAESVDYGFDAVPEVRLPSGVDEDEADAILSFFEKKWEGRMREAGVKPEDMPQHMMMRHGDRDTLKMLITGVTHKEAIRRLNEAFEISYDDKNIKLDGKKMKDAVGQISNDYASKSAGGGSKGITFMDAKMEWQDYIYENEDKFGWGKFCDNTLEKITQAKQLWELEAMYRVKLEAAQVKKDPMAIKKISRKLSQISGQAKQFLNMPHFLILFGEAASGKSSFAEAFANLMGFKMANVDISQAKGKFAGDTETQTKAILEAMKNMSNVVIRMDEVDGQMPSNESAAINSHEGSMVSQLLSFFNDNVALMDHRNIFVVATTNNPGNVRSQMLSRGQPKEVPCPYGKVGYMKWLSTAPDRLRRQYGRNNFVYGDFKWHGKDYAIANATESSAFVNEAWTTIDLDAVANALVAKGEGLKIDFRSLATLFQDIFVQFNSYVWTQLINHALWVNNRQEYADENPSKCTVPGDPNSCPEPNIVGFDLTTEHVVACIVKTVSRQVGGFGTRTDGTNKVTTNGSEAHAEHMSNERNKAKGKGKEQGLLFTDEQMFQNKGEEEEEDLLTPAGKNSGTAGMEATSTNHFFNALVKDGLISWDGRQAFVTPVAPVAPGVMKADIKPTVTTQSEPTARKGRKTLAERIGTYRVGNAILAPVDKQMIL
jgi:hypothetical protein